MFTMGTFVFFCLCILMYRVAEFEQRRGWLWMGITFVLIILMMQVFSSAYIPSFLGAAAAFLLMTFANIKKPVNRGPF